MKREQKIMRNKVHRALIVGMFFLAFLAGGDGVRAQSSDALINVLVKKGILTQKEADQVRAEAKQQKQSAPKASALQLPSGKHLKVRVGGFLQANASFGDVGSFEGHLGGSTVPGIQNIHSRFRLRRARINVSGDLFENFDYKLEGDFQQGDGTVSGRTGFSASDLFVNWHQFPEANVKVGQYKAPFGLEQLTSDTTMFTAERSLVTGALTPERQVGVEVWGEPFARLFPANKQLLGYSFGVFNGSGRNLTVNDNPNFMYAGRLVAVPFQGRLFGQNTRWSVGADGLLSTYGNKTRIGQTGNLFFDPVLNDGTLVPLIVSGTTPTMPPQVDSRAWGLDQTLTFGPFDLTAEYLEERVEPVRNANFFKRFVANGYYIQGAYAFDLGHRKTQLVSKYESFNPGQRPHDNIESLTGGVNYYIKGDQLKLMLDYIHSWSDYRHSHPGTGEDQFDQMLLRMQVMF